MRFWHLVFVFPTFLLLLPLNFACIAGCLSLFKQPALLPLPTSFEMLMCLTIDVFIVQYLHYVRVGRFSGPWHAKARTVDGWLSVLGAVFLVIYTGRDIYPMVIIGLPSIALLFPLLTVFFGDLPPVLVDSKTGEDEI